jgi:hypothetical protein
LLAILLAGLLVALVPLAHASPPDETWIAGLYDDGDYDDVVLALADAISLPTPTPMTGGAPTDPPEPTASATSTRPDLAVRARPLDRAPPAA